MTDMSDNKINNPELTKWVDDFWQWSCHIYQNQDVAKICIAVQDTLGLNVNYMLMALWARQQKIAISMDLWKKIEQESASAVEAIGYIRQKRMGLKDNSEEIYQQALLIELKAEQEHQKQAIQTLYKEYQVVAGDELAPKRAKKNLQHYLESNQVSVEHQETVQQLGQLVDKISLDT